MLASGDVYEHARRFNMINSGLAAAALAAFAFISPSASQAQANDDWTFQASIYGYLPSISGSTTFSPTGASGSATVDVGTILDNLKFTFMGTLEAQQGPWGMFTDVIYLNLGNSKAQTRAIGVGGVLPADVSANVDFDLKSWLWTLAGEWRAVSTPEYRLDVIGGARMLDIQQKLNWQLSGNVGPIALPDRSGARSVDMRNWDAIIGAKGRATFGERRQWFLPYYLDVGAGDSKLTWQAMAGVGYTFGWGDLVGVWRYVDYQMKSGKPIESMNFNGPAIAAAFRW